MRLVLSIILFLCLVSAAWGSPLTGASRADDSAISTEEPGPISLAINQARHWLATKQRQLQRTMSTHLRELQHEPSAATAWSLILISFVYGILHAAGPGHGKVIISTYLLTHRQQIRQGILIAFLATLLHGLTAIALVLTLVKLGGWLTRDAMSQVRVVEMFSFALVALLGGWLMVRGIGQLWRGRHQPTHSGCCATVQTVCADHSNHSKRTLLAVVLAVGLRPCTGAVMVLAVANLLNLWGAGVVAVLAMSIGSAITVSILAVLAIQAHHLLERIPKGRHSYWQLAAPISAIVGGLAVMSIGLLLLQGTTTATPHPLYSSIIH